MTNAFRGALLSVVVIGRNEGKRLEACLASVRSARNVPERVELIYVDSQSTDGSAGRAESFGAKVVLLSSGKHSAARARNAGWRLAVAPFVLFLDGDTILHPDFIHRALSEFKAADVSVVAGNRREIRPEQSIYNRVLDLDWMCRPGYAAFCGGDSVMRRDSLENANGFDPDLIAGEEPDLCRRMRALGCRILHIDAPMTGHDLALFHFSQYWRRAVRTGHAYAEVSTRYRDSADPLWSRESRANIVKGSLYAAVFAAAFSAAILFHSMLPVLAVALGGAVAVLRTARSFRWKCTSWKTLLLFGIHSHFQHLPILQGQLLYFWGRWRGQRRGLIEYKSS